MSKKAKVMGLLSYYDNNGGDHSVIADMILLAIQEKRSKHPLEFRKTDPDGNPMIKYIFNCSDETGNCIWGLSSKNKWWYSSFGGRWEDCGKPMSYKTKKCDWLGNIL